jgi:hypothetical protein
MEAYSFSAYQEILDRICDMKKMKGLTTDIFSVSHPAGHDRGVSNLEKPPWLLPFAKVTASVPGYRPRGPGFDSRSYKIF